MKRFLIITTIVFVVILSALSGCALLFLKFANNYENKQMVSKETLVEMIEEQFDAVMELQITNTDYNVDREQSSIYLTQDKVFTYYVFNDEQELNNVISSLKNDLEIEIPNRKYEYEILKDYAFMVIDYDGISFMSDLILIRKDNIIIMVDCEVDQIMKEFVKGLVQ